MEEFQEQEYEFLRRLEEERIDRRTLVRRGLAAGIGLTVLSLSPAALAARKQALANPPVAGRLVSMAEMIKEAKKEGSLNTIALPRDWANYGEMMDTFGKKYGIKITNDNPDGSSAQENQAIRSLKGDSRAPDCVDVGVSFAIAGANEGLYAKYFPKNYKTIPRAMKDTRGFWMGDYWGAISIGYNRNLVSNPPKTWKDLLKPEYKGKVALNGSPLTSNSAVSGVIAAAMGNGGSVGQRAARHRLLLAAEEERQLHPGADDTATVASGQTPISIDWDYNNFAYIKGFPSAKWGFTIPSDGVYGGYYCAGDQRDRSTSVGSPSLGGVPLLRPGPDHLAEGCGAPGAVQRPRRPQGDPDGAARRRSRRPRSTRRSKFASIGQQTRAKEQIAKHWPTTVGA